VHVEQNVWGIDFIFDFFGLPIKGGDNKKETM
jgi:hypothetical protein